MTEYERLVALNAALRKVLAHGAEERLRRIPGVRHVSIGLRSRANKITDELCIRVYVAKKRPASELSDKELIPREIDGIATDVNTPRRMKFSVDFTRYRPLKGGMMITNLVVGVNEAHTRAVLTAGTFGCTATRNGNGKTVLLSNWHVLTANLPNNANDQSNGEAIYNPAPDRLPDDIPLDILPYHRRNDDDVIAYIRRARITNRVDAGIAELDISSCCRCCGLDYRDEIIGLSEAGVPPTNQLHGLRAAVPGSRVFKVGITTGRTEGRVVTDSADDVTGHIGGRDYTLSGQIEISSSDPLASFSLEGDSGSVIVDEGGYAVGLLFGNFSEDNVTYANHMSDVCTEMDIHLNLVPPPHGTGAPAEVRRVTVPRELSPTGAELYAKARARVESDPAGRWLWAVAEVHREEIVTLVTGNRRVNVVWQRAGGPAIFAAALKALRAGDDETLPSPPDGGTLELALARVGAALAAHGSEALRTALARHREAILSAARGSRTLTELLANLQSTVEQPA